jgi:hypothetical protein
VDDSAGLSTIDAEKRLEIHGPNKIDGSGQVSLWEVLLRQVSNSLTIVSSSILYHVQLIMNGCEVFKVLLPQYACNACRLMPVDIEDNCHSCDASPREIG